MSQSSSSTVVCLVCENVIIISNPVFSVIWMECRFVYGVLWARLQTGGWGDGHKYKLPLY